MYGDDSAIAFVFNHKTAAKYASNWDSFCDMAKADGDKMADYYRDYKWLPQFYRTAKYHPELDYISKALYLPQAKCLGDIVTGIEYRKSLPSNGRREGGYYIGSPLSASRGRHTYDAKRDIATLHNSKWCNLYAAGLTTACKEALDRAGMMEGAGSFDCIRWPDGRYLVICRDKSGIGERWVTLLPADYDFMADISEDDRAFIAADIAGFEEAIKDAPAESRYKKVEA